MTLTLILGPMGSGKSQFLLDLAKTQISNGKNLTALTHIKNVRDIGISSRNGMSLVADKVKDLSDYVMRDDIKMLLIDEIHLFDYTIVSDMLLMESFSNPQIVVCGLEHDYKGMEFPVITELKRQANNIIIFRGDCDLCGKKKATIETIVIKNGKRVRRGLPSVLPDNGSVEYLAVCKECFNK